MKIYNYLIYGFSILMLILCTNLSAQDYWQRKDRIPKNNYSNVDQSKKEFNYPVPLSRIFDPGTSVWTSSGPPGGYVNSISFSTSDQGVVYAGTISGVYKSTDGGETWSFAGLGGIDINKVLVDPENAGIVYVGVGRIPGREIGEHDGLYKSTDAGKSWTNKHETWVTAIAIDPTSPNTIYIGTKSGEVIKSQDGGEHWTLMHQIESSDDEPIEINAIQVDPEASSNIFATIGSVGYAWGGRNGLLKSTDAGETWKTINIGSISPNEAYNLIITPAGHVPQALYAIARGGSQVNRQRDVFVSTDKGETWTALNVPVIGRIDDVYSWVQTICIDLSDPDWIYVSTTNSDYHLIALNESERIGKRDIGNGLPESAPTCLAVNPFNTEVVLAGYKDGMLYKSGDHAENWEKTEGVSNSNIFDMAIHPQISNYVYAVVDGHRPIQKTEDGGATWSDLSPEFPENFASIAIDPSNPLKMFVGQVGYDYRFEGQGYILRTEDGGDNWNKVDYSMSGTVKDIWIHPTDPNIVLAIKEGRYYLNNLYNGGLRRSIDGGDNWTQVFNWGWPNCITSDPNNHDHVYIGVERLGYVLYSPDAGITWDNISPGNIWYNVYDIVVDSNSNVYATTSEYEENEKDGIWKMEWKSETSFSWSHVYRLEDTRVTALAIDRRTNPATLYAGTSGAGVYVSQDGGESWSEFNNGLRITNIAKLEISSTEPKMLYAGTEYGGVWRIDITTDVESKEMKPQVFHLSQNYPNPFNPSTTIQFSVPERVNVKLTIYNMLGQKVARLAEGEVERGVHELTFDASHLPSGVYIYRLQAGDYVESRKMLYLK
jgi:photosystem II stability/assembly factor-like uncharacterized protein